MRAKLTPEAVARAGLCTGCGLCESALGPERVEMQMSPDGFLRPRTKVELTETEVSQFERLCPGVLLEHLDPSYTYDVIWGPIETVRVGYAKDPEVRFKGSSGGALSAILLYLLETGEVDFVVQTAAAADPLRNTSFAATSRAEVIAAAGSRYSPSSPLSQIHEFLEMPGRFAFVGKPCDVAGLRNLARHDPRVDDKVAYMISFMCAGIPSQRGTEEILKVMGIVQSEVASMRYRGEGWPGMTTVVTKSGHRAAMNYQTAWGRILNRHLQLRCKICADGTGEFADVVCADAWYGDDAGFPSFDEQEGRSLIVSRTDRGEHLVCSCIKHSSLYAEPLPLTEIVKMQPYQAQRKRMVRSRLFAFRLLGRHVPLYMRMGVADAARTVPRLQRVRTVLGTLRRLLVDGLWAAGGVK